MIRRSAQRSPTASLVTSRRAALAGGVAAMAAGWDARAAALPGSENTGSAPRFVVALNGHEDERAWGEAAAAACVDWWPKIVGALPDASFVSPAEVTLAVVDIGIAGVPAATRGDIIGVDAGFLAAHPNDRNNVDLLAHELTHVVQRYPEPRSGWLTEGVADWIRYYVLLPADPRRQFRPRSGVSYANGYQPAAALLNWCEQRSPGLVAEVHRAMRRGDDGPATLARLAGAPVDSLWRSCRASRVGVPAPAN